jgi:hypothetical protein
MTKLLVIFVLLIGLSSCAPGASNTAYFREFSGRPETIAVLRPSNFTPISQAIYEVIYDEFVNHKYVRTRFDLVDRTRIDTALSEIQFGSTGFINNDSRIRLGQLLSARYLVSTEILSAKATKRSTTVLFVTVNGYDVNLRIALRVIDVESGRVLGSSISTFNDFVGSGVTILPSDRNNSSLFSTNGITEGDTFILNAASTTSKNAIDMMLKSFNGE